jgi:hypothetical protein
LIAQGVQEFREPTILVAHKEFGKIREPTILVDFTRSSGRSGASYSP